MQCMQAQRNIVVSTETPQTSTNPSQALLPVYKLAHLPLLHPKSSPPKPPQPSAQPLRRCATDVSIRSRLPAKIYLKCISFIYMYICYAVRFFFTSEGRIRAVMYMSCVKCSCSELKLAKHLHTLFVFT